MFAITGGAGFIGSNLARALAQRGADVLVVDDLTASEKFRNLAGITIAEYYDRQEFASLIDRGDTVLDQIEAVLHQGANTTTTETDGRLMMRDNFADSKRIAEFCLSRRIPLVYASSAAVYGNGPSFREEPACEAPVNVYGFSKLTFDQWMRRAVKNTVSRVVGLRYFNVYGPGERHKGAMASMVFQLYNQLRTTDRMRLFGDHDGWRAGEQRRDFVHVDDVVRVNLWFLDHPSASGIFNVGTGRSRSFNELATLLAQRAGRGEVEYVSIPDTLRMSYQSVTEADLSRLRAIGYRDDFELLESGVARFVAMLDANEYGRAPRLL
jgi:ADP-L-glycero-D-manno-heptose 6-epimerase